MIAPIEALEIRRLLAFVPIQLGSPHYDVGSETVMDAQGNTITAGIFSNTVNFNPLGTTAVNRTAVGETDIYIAKYDPNGALIWVGQVGGAKSDENTGDLPIDPNRAGSFVNRVGVQPDFLGEHANALALDSAGNIFLGGTFYSTGDFNPTPNGVFNLTSVPKYGLYDAFLLKITSSGGFVWAKNFGGPFNDVINGIAIDAQDNPIVTGYFTRIADFDPNAGEFIVEALGRDDIFVAEYAGSNGSLAWVRRFGGEHTDQSERDAGNGITIDSSGNIYITGTLGGKADFDPTKNGEYIVDVEGATDVLVMKLDSVGKLIYAETFGGGSFDGGVKIAQRGGFIYTASYFTETIDVNPNPNVTTEITSVGDDRHTDLLVSKFNASNGALVWAKPMGSDGYETIGGFSVANDGSVYTSGGFYDTSDFDPGPGQFLLTSVEGDEDFDDPNDSDRESSYDIYVSKLSANGKFQGATRIGSSGDDFGGGLVAAADSSFISVTGQFRNTVPFNTLKGTVKRKSKGIQDAFLIELTSILTLLQ